MRILQVVCDMHPRAGGPPRVVAGAATALAHAGHTVAIAATVHAGEADAVRAAWPGLHGAGVDLRLFEADGLRALGGSTGLARALNADPGRYDVCHLHGIWDQALVAAARAARRAGRPYLVSPHGMLDRWSMARSRTKKRLALHFLGVGPMLRGAAALVYGTDDEAGEASGLALPGRVEIVPNGVDPAMLAPPTDNARARLHDAVPQSRAWRRIVLFYARLHRKKGLDLLIDAFAQAARTDPAIGLLAAGIAEDPAYEAAVRARATATGLGDRILVTSRFSGPDSRFLLDAADLFVLPSHQEGFSIAIIEALARGLPALITDRCHLPDVQSAGAGRVVAPVAAALADGLRDLLALDDAALRAMGERGRRLVADRYTWPQVARHLAAAYRRAAS